MTCSIASRMGPLKQRHIDWLLAEGVSIRAMIHPNAILCDPDDDDLLWFQDDEITWQTRTNRLRGGEWCLGMDEYLNTGCCALGGALRLHTSPLDWLRARRRGIVVVDWAQAFDKLRDVPRISVAPQMAATYRKWMRPAHMPELVLV